MTDIFASIKLDPALGRPLYVQLYESIKKMLEEGILPPDFRLPSIRRLADLLNVNQVTVVSAYKLLISNGYAYSKTGSGTYTTETIPSFQPQDTQIDNYTAITDEVYYNEDISFMSSREIKIDSNTINFASATPTPDLFPVDNFKKALDEVLERDRGNAFSYQEGQGFYPLRESIASVICEGLACSSSDIQIISGAQQGIDIISKAFLRQGDYVITESPTYTGAVAVFKSRGARIIDVDIAEDGPNLNIIEYNLKKYKPRLIYTIPSFQNPTGYSYSNAKRIELIRLAEKYNAYIIEDDYVSEMDFDGRSYLSLKSLDSSGRVIFIKSFSKIFMPGLRLGYMIVPSNLKHKVLEAKHTTDISTSGLIQRAFDLYIREGFWNSHMKYVYEIYKERYFKAINTLKENLPNYVNFNVPGGGLNIWLTFQNDFPVDKLYKNCSSGNIVFAPGRIFYSSTPVYKAASIRLSFAAVYTDKIDEGISKLCAIIRNINDSKSTSQYTSVPIL